MKKIIILTLMVAAFFSSCSNSNKPNQTFDPDEERVAITEKYWKLITLYGQEVQMSENQEREAFFRLTSDGKLAGFGGCNAINGNYTLEKGFRIQFDKVATSLRACDEGIDESSFLKVFNTADNYSLSENDSKLTLNKARMAPLAVFRSVVFK